VRTWVITVRARCTRDTSRQRHASTHPCPRHWCRAAVATVDILKN